MNSTIGPYTIDSELGRGGMGVVYRATDTRLGRTVAIKALPEELASDPGRLERFEREARTLAQLNHPNLAGIHGLEEHDGSSYLVLEFVEGETLADRLDRGVLDLDDAVRLGAQIAAGVAAAHDAGVVHRDLKPANIIVTPEGNAKVLDFGLARTDDGQSSTGSGMSQSPTMTSPARHQHSPTIPGAILGTAAYMSPEQARGRRVDQRTDVWSFGVVLYEMLCGASPFVGETASDSIGAVLHKSFDLNQLPAGTPANVRRVLKRCLERDKEQRYHSLADARLELLSGSVDRETAASIEPRGNGARLFAACSLVVALVAVAYAVIIGLNAGTQAASGLDTSDQAVRDTFRFELPQLEARFTSYPQRLNLSPADSRIVAWAGHLRSDDESAPSGLCVLNLETGEARRLEGTEHADALTFSPDGRSIMFHVNPPGDEPEEFRRVSVDGGPVLTVLTETDTLRFSRYFFAWDEPGSALVLQAFPFQPCRLSLTTGELTELGDITGADDLFSFGSPRPAGDGVVFFAGLSASGLSTYTMDLETRNVKLLMRGSGLAHLLPGNRVALVQQRALCVAEYDPKTRSVVSELTPVLPDIWESMAFTVSEDGNLLAIRSFGDDIGRSLHAIDRAGNHEPLIEQRDEYIGSLGLTPEGDAVYIASYDMSSPTPMQGSLIDLATGGVRRAGLPSAFGTMTIPEGVLPDGRLVGLGGFDSWAKYRMVFFDPDRPGEEFIVLDEPSGAGIQRDPILLNDRYVIFEYRPEDERENGLYWLDLEVPLEERRAQPLVVTASSEGSFRVSPEGDWAIYQSTTTGGRQVLAQRFVLDENGPRVEGRPSRISIDGGSSCQWSRDGAEVFFIDSTNNLMVSRAERSETGELTGFTTPEILLEDSVLDMHVSFGYRTYDQLPDGRFIYIRNSDSELSDIRFEYIRNWVGSLGLDDSNELD